MRTRVIRSGPGPTREKLLAAEKAEGRKMAQNLLQREEDERGRQKMKKGSADHLSGCRRSRDGNRVTIPKYCADREIVRPGWESARFHDRYKGIMVL